MAKRKTTSPPVEAPRPPATEEYTVLARRYRPQQFRDLVGQEAVARALVNALESNRVAHAYLFTGSRGVGKTSTARILAKALNCVQGPTATPCDACEICKGIASGEDLDVVEIDGASNNKVDEVRELRGNIRNRPSRARYKIYIIDEVHMLTGQAFNALLKTLEEPPPHVKFIFATTEVQKIPVTILSRCQRFEFAGIATQRIIERLREVVAHEGMQAEDEALEVIARRASGSMRDAQSLLDQLLAFGGDRLTSEQVHRLLGMAQDDRVVGLASAVLERDPGKALELLRQQAEQGLQLGELLDQLIEYWRDLMVVHCAGLENRDLSVPPRHRDALARQAAALNLDTILAGLDVLNTCKARLRGSSHVRVIVEMALIRLARLDDLLSVAQLAQMVGPASSAGSAGKAPTTSVPPPSARSGPPVQLPESGKKKAPIEAKAEPRPVLAELSEATLPQLWPEILAQVAPILAGHLKKADLPAISGPNTLVVRFPAGYNFHQQYCQEPGSVARLEEIISRVTGQNWKVRVEAGNSASAPPPASVAAEPSPSRYRRQRTEAMQEPLVKKAMDLFGAQIVHVDEGFGAAPTETPERTDTEEE